jgi:hypothetical protein
MTSRLSTSAKSQKAVLICIHLLDILTVNIPPKNPGESCGAYPQRTDQFQGRGNSKFSVIYAQVSRSFISAVYGFLTTFRAFVYPPIICATEFPRLQLKVGPKGYSLRRPTQFFPNTQRLPRAQTREWRPLAQTRLESGLKRFLIV